MKSKSWKIKSWPKYVKEVVPRISHNNIAPYQLKAGRIIGIEFVVTMGITPCPHQTYLGRGSARSERIRYELIFLYLSIIRIRNVKSLSCRINGHPIDLTIRDEC